MALGKVGGNQLETTLNIDSGTLYVDGTNNRVGIGTASPAQPLHVVGGAVEFQNTQSTYLQVNTGDTHLYTAGSHPLRFGTNSQERLRIDSSGRVTMPAQPVFSAILDSSPTAVSNAIIPVNNAIVNIGNHFNNSTYTFTAPVSGNYFLSYFVRYNGYQASIYLHPRFYKNGSALFETHQIASTGGAPGYTSLTWSGVVQLAANDAITLGDASQGSVTLGTYQASQTGFTGHLIG